MGNLLEALGPLIRTETEIAWELLRSPDWPRVRSLWIVDHGRCEACGRKENLNVHHIIPFHVRPDLELDSSNFITLCEGGPINCHYLAGHCGSSWSDWSRDIQWSVEALRMTLSLLRLGNHPSQARK